MAEKTALALFAHPDDTEVLCAGALALLRDKGWRIHIATVTPGDCGSKTMSREEIGAVRKKEAAAAARLLDGEYHCLDFDDLMVMYDRPTLLKTTHLIRTIRPSLVFTSSLEDYHPDHTTTSRLVHAACFAAGVRNLETPGAEDYEPVPHLYYTDTVKSIDLLGRPIIPAIRVDVTDKMEIKARMFNRHESQREWLQAHHGQDEMVESMKKMAAAVGQTIGVEYAESFRQHLGEPFPTSNILKTELGDAAHINPEYAVPLEAG